jgi:hypothetical protein
MPMNTAIHAAHAAMAQAIKASGAIVKISPEGFKVLLQRANEPLVVTAEGGVFSKTYEYLMGYKGLVFYTSSKEQLGFQSSAEIVQVQKIWIPG